MSTSAPPPTIGGGTVASKARGWKPTSAYPAANVPHVAAPAPSPTLAHSATRHAVAKELSRQKSATAGGPLAIAASLPAAAESMNIANAGEILRNSGSVTPLSCSTSICSSQSAGANATIMADAMMLPAETRMNHDAHDGASARTA